MNTIEHFMASAERELGAFIRAVSELYGTECAERAAEDWLEEFDHTELSLTAPHFRAVTIAAAVRVATWLNSPVNPQTTSA